MISYRFELEPDKICEFTVDLASDTSEEKAGESYASWLSLERFRCSHCQVPPDSRVTCPAALSIRPLMDAFGDCLSYETVKATVIKEDIRFESVTPMQRALRSLAGLLMALSACPVLHKLRPMAQHHIPFATNTQTVIRYVGNYFIGQYLRYQDGLKPDWYLEGLLILLKQLHALNIMMARRLRAAAREDALINSVILLDLFAKDAELDINDNLNQLKTIYAMYLEE